MEPKNASPKVKLFKCDKCDKFFEYKRYLVVHQRTHMDVKFDCPICGKQLQWENNLKVHLRAHYTDLDQFKKYWREYLKSEARKAIVDSIRLQATTSEESEEDELQPSTSQMGSEEKERSTENNRSPSVKKNKVDVKKQVKCGELEVYYFGRTQGFGTIPQNGEVCLDMESTHFVTHTFSLDTETRPNLNYDSEIVREEDYSSARNIKRVASKARNKLLKSSGVEIKKDENLKSLRDSLKECGCTCANGWCLPDTCNCSLNGIECQIDSVGGPCSCFGERCENPEGRNVFDREAIRKHRQKYVSGGQK